MSALPNCLQTLPTSSGDRAPLPGQVTSALLACRHHRLHHVYPEAAALGESGEWGVGGGGVGMWRKLGDRLVDIDSLWSSNY